MSLENLKAQRQAILQKISKDPKNKKFHQHSLSAVEQQIREFELAAKKNAQSKGGTDDNAMEAEIQQAFKADAYLRELETELHGAQNRHKHWKETLEDTKSEGVRKVYEAKISGAESEILKYDMNIPFNNPKNNEIKDIFCPDEETKAEIWRTVIYQDTDEYKAWKQQVVGPNVTVL
jgi:hypothetical protein